MQVSQSWLLPVFHDVKTSFSSAELSTGKTSRSTFVDHSGYRFSFWFQCLEDYGVWITCWGGHWRSVHTASPQKKVTKHRHRKCNFCPTINLIQISIIIRDGGSQSWLVISREPRLTSRLYLSLTLFFFANSIFCHADRKNIQRSWEWADSREKINPNFACSPFVLKSLFYKKDHTDHPSLML